MGHVLHCLYHVTLFDWLIGCHMIHLFTNNETHGPYTPRGTRVVNKNIVTGLLTGNIENHTPRGFAPRGVIFDVTLLSL